MAIVSHMGRYVKCLGYNINLKDHEFEMCGREDATRLIDHVAVNLALALHGKVIYV